MERGAGNARSATKFVATRVSRVCVSAEACLHAVTHAFVFTARNAAQFQGCGDASAVISQMRTNDDNETQRIIRGAALLSEWTVDEYIGWGARVPPNTIECSRWPRDCFHRFPAS
jgi:hypothetical protein